MVTRISAFVAACCLVAAPLALTTTAHAAVPSATVPAACVDSVSSLTVLVNEVVSFGPTPSGCTVVSNDATGNLDRVSTNGFIAFAAGTGEVFQLMTNGTTQFLMKVNVTIVEPAPTPTPSPTQTASPTGTASPSATGSPTTTASSSAQPTDPPVLAQPDRPLPSQRLRARDITVTPGLRPGQVAFFGRDGMPLQLLSLSGDTEGITVVDDGMNYSTRPSNWQRLGYGDLCWTYAGYAGAQGFVLPIANPPFSTVPANWVLTAAILGTSTGNVTFLEPVPGQVVEADGRDAATLTLCAQGYPNAAASEAARALRAVAADKGGGQYNPVPGCTNGQATGNKHCVGQPTWPSYTTTLGPTSSATSKPTAAPSSTAPSAPGTTTPSASASPPPSSQAPVDDPRLPVCRATGDPENPYRRELVRTSQIEPTGGDRLFPTLGWTDILPPTSRYPAGQNWLPGAALLFEADCRMTVITPKPVQTVSGMSPGPTMSPGPEITGFSPVTIVQPVPQPSFTAYGPVYPWPPLQPVPLTGDGTSLVPTATPTPIATPPSPSPNATPPSPSPVLTPSPTDPTPIATPPSPSPNATPPRPTVTVTPIAQPSFTDFGPVCGTGPCLITPVREPTIPYTTLITLGGGPGSTPTPTATPSGQSTLASPTATPPLPSPESTPSSTGDRPGPDGSRTVTVLLTNGPDTVTFATTVGALQGIIDQTDTGVTGGTGENPEGTTDGRPGTGQGPTELANTGSAEAWLIVGGIMLAGGALLLLPVARGRRLRIGVVVGLTATGLVTSTTAAWSVASAERAFGIAQTRASMDWGPSSDAIARLTFVRPGGQSPVGPDPVYVFDGIDEDTLTRGPGRYPTTATPGAPGTTAIAGHRTGYGSPFADLDELRSGDTIVMQTPEGDRRTYRVAEVRLVDTDDVWVLGPDPLGTGTSTLTLTTCDPPGVNTQRLVVIASLVSGSSPA